MKFLRFTWKLFVMAAVFGVGYIVGREHSFEEEEQWEAENAKNKENAEKPAEGCACNESTCEGCKECKTSNGEVTFEYEDEKANKVAVVGSFNNWNKDADPMNKENSTWKCTKTLEAGTYEYQFVVNDTEWVVDPKAETTVKNKYEGQNSVVVVK